MRLSTILSTLMFTTALTACGGGGGGGHTNIPHTTLPNVGTSIKAVNNTQERTTAYEGALALVGVTTDTSAEEIDKAYENMKKILVQEDLTDVTKEDILLSLALVGEDIEELKEKSLEELKSEVLNSDLKTKAEDVYAKLGNERNLTLSDVVFYNPGDENNRDIITFTVDETGKLTGLKMEEGDGASNLNFDYQGDGVYKKSTKSVDYGFVYESPYGGFFEESFTFDISVSLEEVRETIKKQAQKQWGGECDETTMNNLLSWIDTVDFTSTKNDEEDCYDKGGNCIYKEILPDNIIAKVESVGKNIGLKYSDFGVIKYSADGEYDFEPDLYYGGYKALSVKAKDLPQVNTEMEFKGDALASVTLEDFDEEDEITKMYNGTVDLTFKDGKETIVADFNDWHKVTIETDTTKSSGYSFTFEGTPSDKKFTVLPSEYDYSLVDINYYGENTKNPEEFVGSAVYDAYIDDDSIIYDNIYSEMVFGGVRK